MNAGITRRDFLGSTLLASGALLLEGIAPDELLAGGDEFSGYGGVGEYSRSNGNTLEVLLAGHKIRDGGYDPPPADAVDTGETYDCVIVGGGIKTCRSLIFSAPRGPGKSVLILENHPIFGGEPSKMNRRRSPERHCRCDPGDDSHLLVTGGGRRIGPRARCTFGVLRLRGGPVTPV
jgi:spermidine dehydrogenase